MPAPRKPVTSRARKSDRVDPKNEQQVEDAIKRLTTRLRSERRENAAYRRAIQRNKAQIQKLEAWRRTRKRQLDKIQNRGARAAVAAALRQVGRTESPAGSNRGIGIIDECQTYWLGYAGFAWCGAFAGYHVQRYGGVSALTKRIVYCPWIDEDARAGANGLVDRVPLDAGRPGDLCVFDWQHDGTEDHVGIIVENLGNGSYKTVEGNTSFDDAGSQSNGGAVALRTRHNSLFGLIARPGYKA